MKNRSTLLMLLFALCSFSAFSVPQLNSFPTASATIYLDFDGQVVNSSLWNDGSTLNAAPSGFNDAEITSIFNRVSEDFRPFNVNITTSEAKFFAAPLAKRIRIIVTTTNGFAPGVGGTAYTGSFTWGDDTPGFVFSNALLMNAKWVAECCTHESGHSLGLSHQSKYDNGCNIIQSYNEGIGTGETSWAPVMGNSYYRNLSGWNNGPTPSGCTVEQDNLSVITSGNFAYRTDDHSNDVNVNPTAITITNQAFNAAGIITTTTDKDYFKLSIAKNSVLHFDIKPYSLGNNDGANLDVKFVLLNGAKQIVKTYDPLNILNITIDTVLNADTYYLMVDGAGNANVSDYGSLGSYTIAGTATPISVTPIHTVALGGNSANGKHQLNWNIVSDEPLKSVVVERSANGGSFDNLSIVTLGANKYAYTPFEKNDIYYRLKVTSVTNQVMYSNVVMLKGIGTKDNFTVSTFVTNELKVNATAPYVFQLMDVNGRIISKGKGNAGINTENTSSLASGMYVLHMITNGIRTTERIIKQ